MDLLWPITGHLLGGAFVTMQLLAAAALGILVIGLAAGLAKVSRLLPVRLLASLYVDLARSVPLLVVLFLLYYSLPEFGIVLPVFWTGVVGLAAYYGAYQAEIVRAGIQAIDRGQVEAGLALGMRPAQVMARITLRQAMRVALPPTTGLLIGALKGSAQVAVIALPELLRTGNNLAVATGEFFLIYGLVALFYLAMAIPLARAARALEARVSVP
jgi:His/Glu/Gln/Arg/opine family amino acid ABC transporter permease subunit